MKHTIGYCLDRRTGNYIVTWTDRTNSTANRERRQQIVVLAGAFRRVIGNTYGIAAACIDVTAAQLAELGFLPDGCHAVISANREGVYA